MIAWSQSAGGRPNFLALDGERVRFQLLVTASKIPSRSTASATRGHLVGRRHSDQRPSEPHFGMQQADRVVFGIIGAEGIGTDELRQAIGLVRVGAANRAHFMQHDGNAGLRCLPCGF